MIVPFTAAEFSGNDHTRFNGNCIIARASIGHDLRHAAELLVETKRLNNNGTVGRTLLDPEVFISIALVTMGALGGERPHVQRQHIAALRGEHGRSAVIAVATEG